MEHKHWWRLAAALALLALAVARAEGEVWEESEHEVLIRSERGAKNRETCRYARGAWSDCDSKTNFRSRTLTLKNISNSNNCERTKTIQKKCKKPCRYEKSQWSECSASGEMSRTDALKVNSDPTCEQSRRITKKCNKNKQTKATKDKGRRNPCRYEKSHWSECSASGEMSRTDALKINSDPTCEQSRRITKKCNKNKQTKATKDKGRRNRQ